MKSKILSCLSAIICLLAGGATPAFAQGTAFTYQGRLNSGGNPANGNYDLNFTLFNVSSGAGQVGSTYFTPNTSVSNGLFTVALDFGTNFPGADRWIEIAVRTHGTGSSYTTLAPRQQITPTPMAIFAGTAANAAAASSVSANAVTSAGIQDGVITAAKLAAGQVVKTLNGLADNVTLSAGTNVTLTTSGNTLTIASGGVGGAGIWSVNANDTYYNAGNVGIGTTTPSTYGHGGTAKILEVHNSGTTLNSQAHLMLFSGVNNLLDSSMGTVTWAQPGGMAAYIGALTRSSVSNVPAAKLTFGTRNTNDASAQARLTIQEDGGISVAQNSSVFFGGNTRQMLNLYNNGPYNYGIGVQNSTFYQRAATGGAGFAWYAGGSHTNTQNSPGPGGVTLMTVDSSGNLTASGWGSFSAGSNDYGLYVGGGAQGGIFAFSADGDAVAGKTAFGSGVSGYSSDYGNAIYGNSVNGYGVYAVSGSGDGVYGQSSSGSGVTGSSSSSDGVYGSSGKNGVHGISTSATGSGVWGDNSAGGNGVTGTSDVSNGIGVYGRGAHWAGYFQGNVNVTGGLNVGSSFLTVNGAGGEQAYLGGDGLGADIQIGSQNAAVTTVACYNTANNAYMHVNCSSITIFGGADLAEPFQMTDAADEISQGSVVVIDEENPGRLKLSDRPYDTRVAGVVSGAGGINPGIQMQQKGVLEGGKNISLTGRVYVLADASSGAIKPGDLLTTSDTPGHAMKVTNHNQAQGAILGKAMSSLKEGKGMVLVLVTLQ
jgi:hypothetical protein